MTPEEEGKEPAPAAPEDSTARTGGDAGMPTEATGTPTPSKSATAQALPPSLTLPSGNNPAYLARMSGWNWGACAFHGIWMYAFGMQLAGILVFLSYIFIPCVSIVGPIYLGMKGDELAWRYRHFENFEQFKEVTRIWNLWGIGFTVVTLTIALGLTAWICWYLWQFVQMLTPQMGI